jgi:hypothetical protein
MSDGLPDLEVLMQWTRETLATHGTHCVCQGCLALVRAETGLEEIKRLLARKDARRQREERQQQFRFVEAPYEYL